MAAEVSEVPTDLLQDRQRRGRAMMIVGVVGVVAALMWLLAVSDPFPMWLIIAGGGLVFIGAGAALNKSPDT
jgi:drug/metabolite transporter superfamily protein YnfA